LEQLTILVKHTQIKGKMKDEKEICLHVQPPRVSVSNLLYIKKQKDLTYVNDLVMDMHFKEFFRLGKPSDAYLRKWSALPDVFIGNEYVLKKFIQIMSKHIAREYGDVINEIPPWRRYPNMMASYGLTP
jgi:uncharacterized protein (TIGR01615 family)